MPAPVIAVVIPVFNEHAVLPELFARLAALFDAQRDCAWRAVLVDDGSRDDSAALLAPAVAAADLLVGFCTHFAVIYYG
jgi:glycosyltransferase involved in cell wall biosynthesis